MKEISLWWPCFWLMMIHIDLLFICLAVAK